MDRGFDLPDEDSDKQEQAELAPLKKGDFVTPGPERGRWIVQEIDDADGTVLVRDAEGGEKETFKLSKLKKMN